jgi:hypothetical protein
MLLRHAYIHYKPIQNEHMVYYSGTFFLMHSSRRIKPNIGPEVKIS